MPASVPYRWTNINFSELWKLLSSNSLYTKMIYCLLITAKTKRYHCLDFSVCPLNVVSFSFLQNVEFCFHRRNILWTFPLDNIYSSDVVYNIYFLYCLFQKCGVIFLANFFLLILSDVFFTFFSEKQILLSKSLYGLDNFLKLQSYKGNYWWKSLYIFKTFKRLWPWESWTYTH